MCISLSPGGRGFLALLLPVALAVVASCGSNRDNGSIQSTADAAGTSGDGGLGVDSVDGSNDGGGIQDGGGIVGGADAGIVDGADGGTVAGADGGSGGADGGALGGTDGGPVGGGTAACSGVTPPASVSMKQFGPQADATFCGPAAGDANGTLAFPITYQMASSHGSSVDFARTSGETLGNSWSMDSTRVLQQPEGFAAVIRHWSGPPDVRLGRWNASGQALPDASWWYSATAGAAFEVAADPKGGMFLAGDLAPDYGDPLQHAALMVTGGGAPYAVRWGPTPLASAGKVLGAGVDVLGRALVVTDGSSSFGAGTLSAQ